MAIETYEQWAAKEREANKVKADLRKRRKGPTPIFHDQAEGYYFMPDSSIYCCFYCGCRGERCTRDHFWPKSIGGIVMVYACRICQISKANKLPDEWVEQMIVADNRFSVRYKENIRIKVDKLWEHIHTNKIRYKIK